MPRLPQPVAIVLHLMEPVWAVREDGRSGGDAELKHAAKVVIGQGFANKEKAPAGGAGALVPSVPIGEGTSSKLVPVRNVPSAPKQSSTSNVEVPERER